MELWAEYEGKTIDGAFPLNRLLSPEGSSAFFTTSKEDGRQRVIRLIDSRAHDSRAHDQGLLNFPDDDAILSRWRGVAALDHPNILKLEDYGQVVVDHTSLVYAVMEPVDANLGEAVGTHLLSLPETRQIALSLLSVLQALHSHGFIHEHVQPDHVVAVNDVVKLQCDCIRDAPEGDLGQQLKQRDVQDLAALILQALTKERTIEAATATASLPLPAPFEKIVRKGIAGEWGLAEIAAALEIPPAYKGTTHSVTASAAPASPAPIAAPTAAPTAASAAAPIKAPMKAAIPDPIAVPHSTSPPASPSPAPSPAVETPSANAATDDSLVPEDKDEKDLSRLTGVIAVAIAVAVLLLAGIAWQFLPQPLAKSANPAQPATTISTATGNATQPSSASKPTPTIANRPAPPVSPRKETTAAHGDWRVVAYTYRHEDQARKKAATIARRHPNLHPEVFQPNPSTYLVTIGGTMDREQALALERKAHHEGLPLDTYARNYTPKQR